MKVLHVAESIKGGVGTYLNQIVPLQVRDLGPEAVRVLVPEQHAVQIPAIPSGIVRTFDRPARSPGSLFGLARAVRRAVREFRPDVIHAQSTFAGAVVRTLMALQPRRPRIVYCPHGWVFDVGSSAGKQKVAALAERAMAPLCDTIVAISDYEARQALRFGIPGHLLRVVSNGISAEVAGQAPFPWHDARLKILFVGRLDRQKGFDILLEAIEGLDDDVAVRVVGEAIQRGAGRAVTPPNVEMLGWRSEAEIDALMRASDLVVMPSRWEGFGLVAAEAMRAGVPVLAAAVGGLPEIVVDGVTGALFPREDAGRLRELLLDSTPAARARQGAAGRERFLRSFTCERTHDGLMAIYRDLVDQRSELVLRAGEVEPVEPAPIRSSSRPEHRPVA